MKQGIIFESSTPYSQEENSISKRIKKTFIDIMQTIILEKGIDNTSMPKIILAIIHVKNLQLI